MAKSKPKNWALGRWSINSMSMWDKEYIEEEVPGYFEFGPNGLGSFHFGYVQGDVDYRVTEVHKDGMYTIRWSRETLADIHPVVKQRSEKDGTVLDFVDAT